MKREIYRKVPTRAGGIIFDKSHTHIVLVLNKDSYYKNENKWGLPKGHLYDYERKQPYIGAQREIWEETGIFFPIYQETFSISIYDTLYYVLTLDKEYNANLTPNDTNEIAKVCWFPITNLHNLNVNRTLAKIIKKWRNIFPNNCLKKISDQ
jgi:ADP-ribose pyrophosphatase YjhB (NUDIX family)